MVQSHLPPFENLAISFTAHLPVSFGRDTKSRWSLLSGFYARGSRHKRSHTRGRCVTLSWKEVGGGGSSDGDCFVVSS